MYYEPRHESRTIAVLNYPVGLHYPCFDLILSSRSYMYFKPSHESSGAADLSLMVKKINFQNILLSRGVFRLTVSKQSFNNNDV